MNAPKLTSKTAFAIFIILTLLLISQTIWWITFMEILMEEKNSTAIELGASAELLEELAVESEARQIMLFMEGMFFLTLILLGAWLIYNALEKTRDLNLRQQNFILAVSHELKTPLTSIKLFLNSLQSTEISTEKKKEIIPKIEENVNRLQKLIENILNIGDMERNDFKFNLKKLNFTEFLNTSCQDFISQNFQKNLQVSYVPGETVFIKADKQAIGFVIDAILENSMKYNGHNENEKIKINLSLIKKNGKLVLKIEDNGIGMLPEETDKIFDRFYRIGSELTRKYAGTGIGLYLVREIVNAHNGNVEAFSEGEQKGLTVKIYLPEYVDQ